MQRQANANIFEENALTKLSSRFGARKMSVFNCDYYVLGPYCLRIL